jgi:NAD-dependent deacetylase
VVDVTSTTHALSTEQRRQLSCPKCGGWLRPHVLWFDEYYDEENYRAESALRAAERADLLIVVGTSGATSLPMRIGLLCQQLGATIIDVNPEPNPFSAIAQRAAHGHVMRCSACEALPELVQHLTHGSVQS